MRCFNWSLGALVLASGFGGLAGCGGTTTAGGADSGAALDGSFADGSVTDAPSGGGDSSLADAGASDASADDGGDSAPPDCLALGATTASCRSCCANGYAAGSKVFDRFTAECACQPAFCGPPEAGVADAAGDDGGDAEASPGDAGSDDGAAATDSGLYGTSVCAATCSGKAAPDPACNTCILSTLGSVNDLGPCGSTVLAQCLTDTTCTAYFGCIENCPP